jgi:hypothetical protein
VCRARPAPNSARQPRGLGRRDRGLSLLPWSPVQAPAAPAGRGRCSGPARVSFLAPRERVYYRSISWRDLQFAYPAFEHLKSRDDDVSDCQQRLHLGNRRRPPLLHAHGGGAQRQHRKHSSPSHDYIGSCGETATVQCPHVLPILLFRPNGRQRAAPPTLLSGSSTATCSTCPGLPTPCAPCSPASTGSLR